MRCKLDRNSETREPMAEPETFVRRDGRKML